MFLQFLMHFLFIKFCNFVEKKKKSHFQLKVSSKKNNHKISCKVTISVKFDSFFVCVIRVKKKINKKIKT